MCGNSIVSIILVDKLTPENFKKIKQLLFVSVVLKAVLYIFLLLN